MQNNFEVKDTEKKNHKNVFVNGTSIGIFERSDIRHFIEALDNSITVELKIPNRIDLDDVTFKSRNTTF
jgi:hypothetical protein